MFVEIFCHFEIRKLVVLQCAAKQHRACSSQLKMILLIIVCASLPAHLNDTERGWEERTELVRHNIFQQERSVPYGAGYLQHRSERLKGIVSSSEPCYLCATHIQADATLMEKISSAELPLDEKISELGLLPWDIHYKCVLELTKLHIYCHPPFVNGCE